MNNNVRTQIPLKYPFADELITPGLNAIDIFAGGNPRGITIHYTADDDINRAIAYLNKNKLAYHLIIDRKGKVVQNCYLTSMCWHAGKARWNNLSPNYNHVSISLVSWGLLNETSDRRLKAWNGQVLRKEDCNWAPDNIDGGFHWWHSATDIQIKKLFQICRWLMNFGITPDDICDHSECAIPIGRKQDVGGVLPFSMDAFRRELINTQYNH